MNERCLPLHVLFGLTNIWCALCQKTLDDDPVNPCARVRTCDKKVSEEQRLGGSTSERAGSGGRRIHKPKLARITCTTRAVRANCASGECSNSLAPWPSPANYCESVYIRHRLPRVLACPPATLHWHQTTHSKPQPCALHDHPLHSLRRHSLPWHLHQHPLEIFQSCAAPSLQGLSGWVSPCPGG